MTACVNRKHTKKVAAVVTASLVGALSLGAAPVAAMADTGIDMQALKPADAFRNGTVAATNGKGEAVTFPAKDDVAFSAGSGEYLLPESITIEGSTINFDLSTVNGNVLIKYFKGGSTTSFAEVGKGADPAKAPTKVAWTADSYEVEITYYNTESQYNGLSKTIDFDIVDTDLTKAEVFNASNGNEDATQTSFTYNGTAQSIGLAVDGVILKSSDYAYEIVDADGRPASLQNAGDYTVNVYEPGETSSTSAPVKSIKVTVAKLNLSNAGVTISDTTGTAPTSCTAGDVTLTTASANKDKVTITVNANIVAEGEYTATVKPADSAQTNITGSATVTFNKVAEVVTDFQYNGNAFPSSMNVDLSKPVTAYDESLIEVFDTAGTKLSTKDYDIWYTDKNGNEASASDLGTLGTWKVNIRVNAERSDYAIGSDTHTITVKVTGGTVASQNVVFKYNGEVAPSTLAVDYSGSNVLDAIETVVRSNGKVLEAGTDYTIKVVDNATGDEVEQIVDAGTYTVTVESDNYSLPGLADRQMTVNVRKLTLDGYVYAKSDLMQTFGTQTIIPYTGDAIDADFTFGYFTDADGNMQTYDADKNYTWNELPAGVIDIDGIKYFEDDTTVISNPVDDIKDAGFYELTLSLGTAGAKNYTFTTAAALNKVEVSDAGIFADVPNDAWYSEVVYTAKKNGYINGYAGTQLFGPERDITRAEVVCILYNMAGGHVTVGSDLWYQYTAYATKFDDVDTNMYYAQAIGWAAKFGVVNGYGDGTFAPEKNVTREEFAAMLANYAKAMNDFEAASSDALSSFTDADMVADWAMDSVAWAVDNKIMGNNGSIDPTSDISRAEVAAMAVNYQPEKITDNFLQ